MKIQVKWTENDHKFLKETYPTQGSFPTMKRMGVSRGAVKSKAALLDIKCIKPKNLNKLQPLLEESPGIYYWLGFIMADGYLDSEGELRVTVAIKDIEHLRKLGRLLNAKVNIDKRSTYCTMGCKDAHYGVVLRDKLGIDKPKTYNPPVLLYLQNRDRSLAFIAGFIDGDGHVGYKGDRPYLLRVSCHSSWMGNLIIFQSLIANLLGIKSRVGLTSRGYSYWSLSNGHNINLLKQEFLNLNLPIMERKWRI